MRPRYLHLTKTGGTSIRRIFTGQITRVRTLEGVREAGNHDPDRVARRLAKTFTMVRNPYSKLVSHFFHFRDKRKGRPSQSILGKHDTFRKFCLELPNIKLVMPPGVRYLPSEAELEDGYYSVLPGGFGTMSSFVESNGLKVPPENIFKMENFDESIEQIAKQFNLTYHKALHLNASNHKEYQSYYDAETQRIVYEYYKEDFERFGYDYEVK